MRGISKKKFHILGLYKQKKRCYNIQAFKKLCTGGSMDRASDSGSEGWGFESLPVYQKNAHSSLDEWAFFNEINPCGFVKCPSGVKYGCAM